MQVNQLSLTVGEVFYTANRNFCLPGVPWDMVSTAPKLTLSSRGWVDGFGDGSGGKEAHSFILLCICVSVCPPPTPQSVRESLNQELCPSFLLPSTPGKKPYSFLRHHLVLYLLLK